ncbi:semaphorin-6B-like [Salvelinus fontinalis]|uniref:semaphorin-6B-like n=1 Tax=Salvelinus fontinalis TaxID=8038 RepID=UPI002485AFFA|nr:semaphorin-6B-like [Salvelinus fontinalis]
MLFNQLPLNALFRVLPMTKGVVSYSFECPCCAAMTTMASPLTFLLLLLRLAHSSFPEEPGPLSYAPLEVVRRYPVFVGRAHHSSQRQELHIQTVLQVNRTLYIGARDDLYRVELDNTSGDEMFYSKKRTWESNKNDIRVCRMKGKHEEECRNFIKVLLSQHEGLFVCGTNAFNPLCANYTRDSLEMVGETVSGMARCPYDPRHANVALFAEGSLFTGTVTDFLAIDAVIYRSLGDSPALRTVKHDSKWFRGTLRSLVGHRPWVVKTMGRYQLTAMVVDTEAGPHRNHTVLFLGSTRGTVLKFLILPSGENSPTHSSVFLEEVEGFNPEKCGEDSDQARQLLFLSLDRPSHTLLLAFPSCMVRLPTARCHLHSRCMKSCLTSRDPYCGWTRGSTCSFLRPGTRLPFQQDSEYGNFSHLGDCDGVVQQSLLIEPESLVSLNLLVASAVSAFTIGAALSGLAVCWIMAHKPGNRRHGNNTPQSTIQRQERGMLTSGGGMGGSVLSVTRQGGGDRPCSQGGETLFVMPNGWGKSGELDPGFLPTPEHTPQQKRRGLRLSDSGSGGWDNSQTYLGGSTMGLASPCPLPCPPHPSTAVYLTTRLFQGGGGGRHGGEERGRGGETPRQHYVCLSKPRGEKGRSGTPKSALRKSAGEYVYPMTPQDSPDRRRVVSAPSAPMEFGEPLPLRWPPQEGYILSSQGMVPVPPSSMPTPKGQQYVAQHHTPGPGRSQLRGALGRGELGELVDLSQLLSKKSSNERTHNGQ